MSDRVGSGRMTGRTTTYTAADLRRMGTKANMRLDNQTIQQVLNALSKK